MINLRTFLKRNSSFVKLYNLFFAKPIRNVNNKNNTGKKALLSYSVYPFLKKSRKLIHPNFIESYKLNKILDELGFEVDIYNNIYNGKINYNNYDLIIGEGLPVSNYYSSAKNKKVKTIYYATGSHPIFNNNQSYKRLINFYYKSGKWLKESSRLVNSQWFLGASLCDSYIIIGNAVTKNSFLEYTSSESVYTINPPFYQTVQMSSFIMKKKNRFLWFGSYGLLHKGLDVVIETFLERGELELHICGYLDGEPEFMKYYRERLSNVSNIFLHGFVSVESDLFKELMETCSFVILTSVSEGLATAVVTAMGNGGLIPIVTKETGVDVKLGVEVLNNDIKSLNDALNLSLEFSENQIVENSIFNLNYIQQNFNEQCFENRLKELMQKIISKGE